MCSPQWLRDPETLEEEPGLVGDWKRSLAWWRTGRGAWPGGGLVEGPGLVEDW